MTRVRKWTLIALALLIVVPALSFAAWVALTLNYSYSSGERTGYVQKFSNKGWLCKTWEGELAMTTQPGVAPQIFSFSVREESVANQLQSMSGERVTLHYEQHPGVPTTCFGETDYFVTGVKRTPAGGE